MTSRNNYIILKVELNAEIRYNTKQSTRNPKFHFEPTGKILIHWKIMVRNHDLGAAEKITVLIRLIIQELKKLT